jgi:hypothetical protein
MLFSSRLVAYERRPAVGAASLLGCMKFVGDDLWRIKLLQNPPYDIDDFGLHLLSKQIDAMKVYNDVLAERIKYERGEK